MSDPLKTLLAQSTPPKANAERKARALEAAQQAMNGAANQGDFEAIVLPSQGTADATRPRHETNPSKGFFMSKLPKFSVSRSYALMGSVAMLAAISTLVAYETYGPGSEEPPIAVAAVDPVLTEDQLTAQRLERETEIAQRITEALAQQDATEVVEPDAFLALGSAENDTVYGVANPEVRLEASTSSEPLVLAEVTEPILAGNDITISGEVSALVASVDVSEFDEFDISFDAVPGQTRELSFASPVLDLEQVHALQGDVLIGHPPAHEVAGESGFLDARSQPVSTFSIDVDTASYAQVRQAVSGDYLPHPGSVRVEELINYFDYAYAGPSGDVPFETHLSLVPTPWNDQTRLLHIGVQGAEVESAERPPANLTFLIDTSGSMDRPEKLGLLKQSLTLLLDTLDARDTVALAAYAGSAGVILQPTEASDRDTILSALDNLRAGGSTAGAAGIELAYDLAARNFSEGALNRVILATDGDFNVGLNDPGALETLIEEKRESGVYLSVLTFGQSMAGDQRAQALAQNGNGFAAHIDTLAEARKALVQEGLSQLVPIAQDVKIQIEFNPANVVAYRLIGYETRALAREDFDDDQVDAGEIGSGHSVTAIYEIQPTQTGVLDAGGGCATAPKSSWPMPSWRTRWLISRCAIKRRAKALLSCWNGPSVRKTWPP